MAERVLLIADRRRSYISNQQHPFSHRLYKYKSAIIDPKVFPPEKNPRGQPRGGGIGGGNLHRNRQLKIKSVSKILEQKKRGGLGRPFLRKIGRTTLFCI
jgi:hypothetical protein